MTIIKKFKAKDTSYANNVFQDDPRRIPKIICFSNRRKETKYARGLLLGRNGFNM